MDTRNGFNYCYGHMEWFSLLLWRKGNIFHYCYGDYKSFSLLLWRKGMFFTTAMEKKYCFHYCYGDNESFSLLLLRRGMVYTTAMDTRNGFHYCYGEKEWFCDIIWYILCFSYYFRHLWNYNEINIHIYCSFLIILDTCVIIMKNKNHIY